jgi:hypothetical protein
MSVNIASHQRQGTNGVYTGKRGRGTSAELEIIMTKPETLFEQASYDLNKFRERRMAERRAVARDTPDRRKQAGSAEPDDMQKDSGQQTS